jgi:hypothetical protein
MPPLGSDVRCEFDMWVGALWIGMPPLGSDVRCEFDMRVSVHLGPPFGCRVLWIVDVDEVGRGVVNLLHTGGGGSASVGAGTRDGFGAGGGVGAGADGV